MYELIVDHPKMGLLRGNIVYDLKYYDYGLAEEDTYNTGETHISVTKDPNGNYPAVTVPMWKLKKL